MSEELNRQRVLSLLDALYAGDVEGVLARCTDDVEFVSHAPVDVLPHLGVRRGKAEIREMWQTVQQRYKEMRHEVIELVAEGYKVAALLRLFFRKRANDRVVQFDLAVFYTLRDGRIARIHEVIDTFDLVEQVLERDLSSLLTNKPPEPT
ncbi:MAG: nuclear transport factor 2 family protein [Bradyrhizobium sp.]|uniref:nuclear transport factor 2 family protein n=1 Tax=Bradyrhizobium sp. TaxID=376 RepID=UPI003D09D714